MLVFKLCYLAAYPAQQVMMPGRFSDFKKAAVLSEIDFIDESEFFEKTYAAVYRSLANKRVLNARQPVKFLRIKVLFGCLYSLQNQAPLICLRVAFQPYIFFAFENHSQLFYYFSQILSTT
jgi:hypothetical protein